MPIGAGSDHAVRVDDGVGLGPHDVLAEARAAREDVGGAGEDRRSPRFSNPVASLSALSAKSASTLWVRQRCRSIEMALIVVGTRTRAPYATSVSMTSR